MELDAFVLHDLNDGLPPLDLGDYDYVLLLDVIEHLASPETFIERLREALQARAGDEGARQHGEHRVRRQPPDAADRPVQLRQARHSRLTHTRLFTFGSFRRLFEQGGFRVLQTRGIPGPFPLALGNGALGRAVMAVNGWLIWLAPGLFSYQMFFVVEPLPSLEYLLREAHEQSALRSAAAERQPAPGELVVTDDDLPG